MPASVLGTFSQAIASSFIRTLLERFCFLYFADEENLDKEDRKKKTQNPMTLQINGRLEVTLQIKWQTRIQAHFCLQTPFLNVSFSGGQSASGLRTLSPTVRGFVELLEYPVSQDSLGGYRVSPAEQLGGGEGWPALRQLWLPPPGLSPTELSRLLQSSPSAAPA